jgi:hypothetical protein
MTWESSFEDGADELGVKVNGRDTRVSGCYPFTLTGAQAEVLTNSAGQRFRYLGSWHLLTDKVGNPERKEKKAGFTG